jgi:two-component system, NarL family, sensor histidine kinase LiaS
MLVPHHIDWQLPSSGYTDYSYVLGGMSMRSIRVQFLLVTLLTVFLTVVICLTPLLVVASYLRESYATVIDLAIVASQQETVSSEWPIGSYGYIVDAAGQITYVIVPQNQASMNFGPFWGFAEQPLDAASEAACQLGERMDMCIPDYANIPDTGRTIQDADGVWYEFRRSLRTGSAVARVRPIAWWDVLTSTSSAIGLLALICVAGALPVGALLAVLLSRRLVRRIQHIATTSQQFANGDLMAQTGELGRDEIGKLGHQFDTMATTIRHQLKELRNLAEQNSSLVLAAEHHARADERAALARDLHDTVAQYLFSLAMGMADLANHIQRDPQRASQQAELLAKIANSAQDEFRHLLTWLRPNARTTQALVTRLESLIAEICQRSNMRLSIEQRVTVGALPLLIEDAIYRVCQEALNNCLRHAHAQHASIAFTREGNLLRLTIRDDGHGFVAGQPVQGFGLIGMHERIRALGGTILIESAPGKGTTLMATIPDTV